jgi:iron complex outermembrane receptor protein
MKKTNVALLVLGTLTGMASAQNAASALNNPPTHVEIVDKAYRADLLPRSARNAYRTTASGDTQSQTITREEIEELRPRDVFDLLNSTTGAISSTGSRKGFSGLSIRGDTNFRWIVDGALLQPTMASRVMAALPVMAIEEIKVVRGANALTMGPMVGSASPGGAPVNGFIVVRTRKPSKDEAQARVALESNSTTQTSAWGGKMVGDPETKTYVAGLLNYSDTDGPSEKLDNGAGYNVAKQSTSGLVKTGLDTAGWLVDFMAYQDEGQFQIPNTNSHGSPQAVGNWVMDPAKTNIFALSGSKGWDSRNTTLLSLSQSKSEQRLFTTSAVQNNNETTHLNLRHNIDVDKTRYVVGGDYMHWNSPTGQQYYEGIQREEVTKGMFAQVEQSLLDDRLTLDASARHDKVDVLHGLDYYTGGAQPPGGVNTNLKTTDKKLPTAKFYSVGSSWALTKDWRLLGRYGESFQPTDGLKAAPNVVLSDDRQTKWELGMEGHVSHSFNPSLNFFNRKVLNEKAINATANKAYAASASAACGAYSVTNITPCYTQSDTVRGGFELAATGAFGDRSSYRTSLTQFTKLSTAIENTTPKNVFDFSVIHGMGLYTVSGAVKYVSSYASTATGVNYLGGYTRYDMGVGRDFRISNTPVKATVYGRNLTDKKYEASLGVQDVGRVLGVEMIAKF